MLHFLRTFGEGLIGLLAVFCWIPMVWGWVKLMGWIIERRERREEEWRSALETLRLQKPWNYTQDFWSSAQPSHASNQPEAPGHFYVDPHGCKQCGKAASAAPELIGHHSQGESLGHCYFFKQPSTAEELEHAVAAVRCSCNCAVRYRGDDSEVLTQISPFSVDNPFRKRS